MDAVDQSQRGVDGSTPGIGELESVEHLPATLSEEIGERTRLAEGDEAGVHPVLQRSAMTNEVEPPVRALSPTAHLRVR